MTDTWVHTNTLPGIACVAFLCICFKGDVCISHAALSHSAQTHTCNSWVKYLYVPICQSYLPVFQFFLLLYVMFTHMLLLDVSRVVFSDGLIDFHYCEKKNYKIIKSLPFHESITMHNTGR